MPKVSSAQMPLPFGLEDAGPPLPKQVRTEVRRLLVVALLQVAKTPRRQEDPEDAREDPFGTSRA